REAKVLELQDEIVKLCKRANEEIITETQAKDRGLEASCITSESDRKLILLQRQLAEKLDCLFVFVLDPNVGRTNNQSERDLRGEAQSRKCGRVSKTAKGAKRRSTILSVFGTLKRRMEQFSLAKLLKVAFDAYAKGISLVNIVQPKNQKMTT
ncbi:MAG: transposase, partial [Planctomycetaceae bacterium]|nr:transposase [Planctomycetaceae bacterium]